MYSNNGLKTTENLFAMIRASEFTEADALVWLFNCEFEKEVSELKLNFRECEKLCWLDDHSTAVVVHQNDGRNEIAVVRLVVEEDADLLDKSWKNLYKINVDLTAELRKQFVGTWSHVCGDGFCAEQCSRCGEFSIVATEICPKCGSRMRK